MDWKEVAAKISDLAPRVGSAVGGPVGALAGMAVQVLAKALGIPDAEVTPEKVAAAVEQDPDIRLKLMAAENDFTLKMRGFQIDELKAGLADIQNARDRQTQHEKVTGKSDINMYLLAWLFVAGFFLTFILMLVLIFTGNFPKDLSPAAVYLIGTMNGTLTAGVGAVIQYFFGKTKDTEAHFNQAANSIPLEKISELMNCVPKPTDELKG